MWKRVITKKKKKFPMKQILNGFSLESNKAKKKCNNKKMEREKEHQKLMYRMKEVMVMITIFFHIHKMFSFVFSLALYLALSSLEQ